MLEGRVYAVTGGATGIGAGIVRVLESYGARVAILQPVDEDQPPVFACDVRIRRAVDRAIEGAIAHFGRLDGVINNAALTGMPAVSPFLEATDQHIDDVLDVNLKGPIYCSQAFARYAVSKRQPGAIIHIASVGAYAAQEHASLYCASKAALVMLAKAMALELAPHGIRVNAVAPGDIFSERSANITAEKMRGGAGSHYTRVTPMGRRGLPEEIGEAVAFLLSDRASFITGETLTVDGGYLAY